MMDKNRNTDVRRQSAKPAVQKPKKTHIVSELDNVQKIRTVSAFDKVFFIIKNPKIFITYCLITI